MGQFDSARSFFFFPQFEDKCALRVFPTCGMDAVD